jgi:hypothetical protein
MIRSLFGEAPFGEAPVGFFLDFSQPIKYQILFTL